MKIVAFAIVASASISARAGDGAPLGLRELTDLLRASSPRLKAAQAAVLSAEGERAAASGARGPRVEVNAFARVATPFSVDVTCPAGMPTSICNGSAGSLEVQRLFSGGATAQLTQPLTDLYALGALHAGAERLRDAASFRARAAESELVAALSAAFYRHAASAAQVDRAKAELAAAQARRDAAASLRAQGAGDEATVLEAELAVATAEAEGAAAEERVEDGRGELEAIVGVPLPAGRPLDTDLTPPPPLAPPAGAEERAAENRAEVAAARAEADAAALKCDAAAQALWPSVALTAEAGPYANAFYPALWASAGAVLRWSALDWGVTRGRQTAACAQASQAREAAADAESGARAGVRRALRADQNAERGFHARERAVAQASELARVVSDRAARGAATRAEGLGAAARLAGAKADLASAAADWLTARAGVQRALGDALK